MKKKVREVTHSWTHLGNRQYNRFFRWNGNGGGLRNEIDQVIGRDGGRESWEREHELGDVGCVMWKPIALKTSRNL